MTENLKKNGNPEIDTPETKDCLGYENLGACDIRLQGLKEFLDSVRKNKVGIIWSCNSLYCDKCKGAAKELSNHDSDNLHSRIFFFVCDNVIYSVESEGFKSLKDYVEAGDRGFLGNMAFDLLECISKKFDLHSVASIYYAAINNGYSSFNEFNKSYKFYGKFMLYDTYKKEAVKAIELGFDTYDDYYDAKNYNFPTSDEYYKAKELKIHDHCEYQDYLTLNGKMRYYGFNSCFEFHIFHILSRLRGGQTLKVEALKDKLRCESDTYSREWYDKSTSEISETLIEDILSNRRKFKELGKLISIEGQVTPGPIGSHKIYSLYRNNTIYVDGSNVAWNNGSGEHGDKPYAKNIEIVVNALKKLDFKEISVLCDNNLYDIIEDKEIYSQLSESHIISAVKRGNTADEWLLRFREGKDCYIISNDKFREYLVEYPELNGYIINFHVTGGEAKFTEKINEVLDGIVPDYGLPRLSHESNCKERF